MRSELVTPPTLLPLTLEETKLYCKVSHTIEDDLITGLIKSAASSAETYARISIAPQSWRFTFRMPRNVGFGALGLNNKLMDPDSIGEYIRLRRGPVQRVASVTTISKNGTRTEVDEALYTVSGERLYWADAGWMQGDYLQWLEVVTEAGFASVPPPEDAEEGTLATVLTPEDIKEALKIMILDAYDNRGAAQRAIPGLAKQKLNSYWTSPLYKD